MVFMILEKKLKSNNKWSVSNVGCKYLGHIVTYNSTLFKIIK